MSEGLRPASEPRSHVVAQDNRMWQAALHPLSAPPCAAGRPSARLLPPPRAAPGFGRPLTPLVAGGDPPRVGVPRPRRAGGWAGPPPLLPPGGRCPRFGPPLFRPPA